MEVNVNITFFSPPIICFRRTGWWQAPSQHFHVCLSWEGGRNGEKFQPFHNLHRCPKSQVIKHIISRKSGFWGKHSSRAVSWPPPHWLPDFPGEKIWEHHHWTCSYHGVTSRKHALVRQMSKNTGLKGGSWTIQSRLSLLPRMTKRLRIKSHFLLIRIWRNK